MSNIRDLKKRIDSEIYGLIADCLASAEVHPKADNEIKAILADAVALRNDLINRTNHCPDEGGPKALKTWFRDIRIDLEKETDRLFENLSSVSKKKKK